MRVALVHDWLTGMRGGERVLEGLIEVFPGAEIFTLLHVRGSVSELINDRPIHTSFIQRIPGAALRYRYLLPLFPTAIESFDLRGFDLVVSSSHCVAKGIRAGNEVPHLCYCHTPMRYVWDQFDAYFGPGRAPSGVRLAMKLLAPRLRAWDVRSADRVDRFVANSSHVRDRITRVYGREAAVVHPPVDLERFAPTADKDDFYVMLGAPAPYKREDLAVEAMRRLGRRLVVIGEGAGRGGVRREAGLAPEGVTYVGWLDDAEVADTLRRARALLMPGVEDFGIGVVEALASGTPIIALGRGGVLDTVHPLGGGSAPPTGVFFDEPTPAAIVEAVRLFEAHRFEAPALAASVRHFGRARFREQIRGEVQALLGRAGGEGTPT